MSMSKQQDDRIHEVKEKLWDKIHDLVDEELKLESEVVEYEVRQRLTEQFRFWKRVERCK